MSDMEYILDNGLHKMVVAEIGKDVAANRPTQSDDGRAKEEER